MKYTFLGLLCILMTTGSIAQNQMALDSTYSGDGLETNLPDFSEPKGILVQSDGKLLIYGNALLDTFTLSIYKNLMLVRFNPDGTLDASFGLNGRVATDLPWTRSCTIRDVVIQEDGKILIEGSGSLPGEVLSKVFVLRYTADGVLDTGFADNGLALFEAANGDYTAGSPGNLLVVNNEKIYIPTSFHVTNGATTPVIIRLNMDGQRDMSFGANGELSLPATLMKKISRIALSQEGNILLLGVIGNYEFVLTQMSQAGVLDPNFMANIPLPNTIWIANLHDMVVQPDGKILIAGGQGATSILLRINPDGSFDPSFANNGLYREPNGQEYAQMRQIILQPDGKIVVGSSQLRRISVTRLLPNGAPDYSFNINGQFTHVPATDFVGSDFFAATLKFALMPDGKIWAAVKNGGRMNLLRYREIQCAF